jgi:hypothetical protein
MAALRANETTAPLLKEGIHKLANTLYVVFPNKQHNEYKLADHYLTYREAWDGVEVIDRTTEYEDQDSEYQVLTNEEATEKTTEYIKDSLWAFNANFLAEQLGLPEKLFTALQDKCEGGNDAILAIAEKFDKVEEIIEAAIKADGRGHFLSAYDGCEPEVTITDEDLEDVVEHLTPREIEEVHSLLEENDMAITFYLYRTN